jgi:SepF-like predicted cell division protein (DUF552 family)
MLIRISINKETLQCTTNDDYETIVNYVRDENGDITAEIAIVDNNSTIMTPTNTIDNPL